MTKATEQDEVLGDVVRKLKATRKYGSICDDTLVRIAGWAAPRYLTSADVLKAAKRKLHQVYGAYLSGATVPRVEQLVGTLSPATPERELQAACLKILGLHASSRERLDIMAEAYGKLWERTGPPSSVVDLACGLNPFALPWMGLPRQAGYYACDIDRRLVASINSFLGVLGRAESAECRDILVSPPTGSATDVILLLKSAPCLEQQSKGSVLELLTALNGRHVVVSFPIETLGGRDVGMAQSYDALMDDLVERLEVNAKTLRFRSEVFYVLSKNH